MSPRRTGRILAIAWLWPATALADVTPQSIEGEFMLYGPPGQEPVMAGANSHYYMHLTGASAQTLYAAMHVESRHEDCLNDGTQARTIGHLTCLQHPDKHQHDCYFSLDIAAQKIDIGVQCQRQ